MELIIILDKKSKCEMIAKPIFLIPIFDISKHTYLTQHNS